MIACQVQVADLALTIKSRPKKVIVVSLNSHFRLSITMKIPETWGLLTRHLKMLGLDWWGLQRAAT